VLLLPVGDVENPRITLISEVPMRKKKWLGYVDDFVFLGLLALGDEHYYKKVSTISVETLQIDWLLRIPTVRELINGTRMVDRIYVVEDKGIREAGLSHGLTEIPIQPRHRYSDPRLSDNDPTLEYIGKPIMFSKIIIHDDNPRYYVFTTEHWKVSTKLSVSITVLKVLDGQNVEALVLETRKVVQRWLDE